MSVRTRARRTSTRRDRVDIVAAEIVEARIEARTGEAVHTITAVAARLQVHPNTLRNYERDGLLTPERVPAGRRYSDAHVRWARLLCVMTKELGLSSEGIRLVLAVLEQGAETRESGANEAPERNGVHGRSSRAMYQSAPGPK